MPPDLTRIIGVGNPLMCDDGLGIKAVELLQHQKLPETVELIDGGCGGLKLLPLFSDCQKLIIIDAADFKAAPGDIRTLTNTDLPRVPRSPAQQSGHHFNLPEILQIAQTMQQLPSLTLYLMQVKSCQPATELTEEISTVLPQLVEVIFRTL